VKQTHRFLFEPTPLAVTRSRHGAPVSLTTLSIYIRSAASIPSQRHQSTPAEQGIVSNRLWQRNFYRGAEFASVSLGVLIIYVLQFTCVATSLPENKDIIGLWDGQVRCLWLLPLQHYTHTWTVFMKMKYNATRGHFNLVHFNFHYWRTTRRIGEAGRYRLQ